MKIAFTLPLLCLVAATAMAQDPQTNPTIRDARVPATTNPTPATQADLEPVITDLFSDDPATRMKATHTLLESGDNGRAQLLKAGARLLWEGGFTRRIDCVYSLLTGLPANLLKHSCSPDQLALTLTKDCTADDLRKMGQSYGFELIGSFNNPSDGSPTFPTCYVRMRPGKTLPDVLRSLLLEEPKVERVGLSFFEK